MKVIELGGIDPGPHAGMVLADLGADVVRVRRPGGLQMPAEDRDLLHRGKRIVDLDVKSQPQALLELAAKADVLLDCFRPGTCERLGIGPDDCAAGNPRLIFARITGWGQDGPLAPTAGHDINYLSQTGALSALGYRDRPPTPRRIWLPTSAAVRCWCCLASWPRSTSGSGRARGRSSTPRWSTGSACWLR
ncbi:coA-transferase III family protein [Mycobacterium ulcerans str. Harvey]|uniref:CoA-transferase III family protein n=1 Tax=Mycobacterium ulcerans str. Harvey TaxID=1299332 RepID=A0ABP3AP78_MYCUL|nr:coA-transferase III family protein [Mycobacterium ulcerans str. Harvey]